MNWNPCENFPWNICDKMVFFFFCINLHYSWNSCHPKIECFKERWMRKVDAQEQAKQSVGKPQRTLYVISWVRRMSVWHSRPKGTNGESRYRKSDWAHAGLQGGVLFGPGTHPAPGENSLTSLCFLLMCLWDCPLTTFPGRRSA